jgi:hypothetical protein
MNTADAGSSEFDSVPAYIRRNMELLATPLLPLKILQQVHRKTRRK